GGPVEHRGELVGGDDRSGGDPATLDPHRYPLEFLAGRGGRTRAQATGPQVGSVDVQIHQNPAARHTPPVGTREQFVVDALAATRTERRSLGRGIRPLPSPRLLDLPRRCFFGRRLL